MPHSTHLNILMTLAFVTACGCSGGGSGGSSRTKLFTTNQPATMVIGQSDFVTWDFSAHTNSTATNQNPYRVAIVGTKLFIADFLGNRVWGFNTLPTAATSRLISADFALGQPSGVTNLTSRAEGTGISGMKSPADLQARGNYLAVSDLSNNRILIYNSIPNIEFSFAPQEVEEIWITFPDPQPQIARIKKRLTSPRFLEHYRNIMKPGGNIHLKTYSELLYRYTLEIIAEQKLTLQQHSSDLYAELSSRIPEVQKSYPTETFSIQTFYEKKFSEKGFKICYIRFSL